jgi:hypothetical protein
MIVARCSCGFAELADESLADHLLHAFVPDDSIAPDGQVHEETDRLTCRCGLAASTTAELDIHFFQVFTPANAVDRAGRKHAVPDVGGVLASCPPASSPY